MKTIFLLVALAMLDGVSASIANVPPGPAMSAAGVGSVSAEGVTGAPMGAEPVTTAIIAVAVAAVAAAVAAVAKGEADKKP